jgi:hypothetical protein
MVREGARSLSTVSTSSLSSAESPCRSICARTSDHHRVIIAPQ